MEGRVLIDNILLGIGTSDDDIQRGGSADFILSRGLTSSAYVTTNTSYQSIVFKVPPITRTIDIIKIKGSRSAGASDNVIAVLSEVDGSDKPSTILQSKSMAITSFPQTPSSEWVSFDITDEELTADTKYCVTVTGSATGSFWWYDDTDGNNRWLYKAWRTTDSGVNWNELYYVRPGFILDTVEEDHSWVTNVASSRKGKWGEIDILNKDKTDYQYFGRRSDEWTIDFFVRSTEDDISALRNAIFALQDGNTHSMVVEGYASSTLKFSKANVYVMSVDVTETEKGTRYDKEYYRLIIKEA